LGIHPRKKDSKYGLAPDGSAHLQKVSLQNRVQNTNDRSKLSVGCNRLPLSTFIRQKLIDITDQAHDDSQFRFSRTVVSALDKYVHCYHVLYRLGLYYHEGWGGHRSLPVGKEYWSQAKGELEKLLKEEEHPLVAFDLGVMWDRGFPYASYEMAFKYYMIASNLNFAKAQYNLALMYAYGEGVPVDHHITTKFYYLASKNGKYELHSSTSIYHTWSITRGNSTIFFIA
jgi:hypothetical protein